MKALKKMKNKLKCVFGEIVSIACLPRMFLKPRIKAYKRNET